MAATAVASGMEMATVRGAFISVSSADDLYLARIRHTVESCRAVAAVPAYFVGLVDLIERAHALSNPAIIDDLPGSASLYDSALWVPTKTGDRLLGGILLGRLHGRPIFAAGDQKLLSMLAGQASLAMENARLFDNLQRTLEPRGGESFWVRLGDTPPIVASHEGF